MGDGTVKNPGGDFFLFSSVRWDEVGRGVVYCCKVVFFFEREREGIMRSKIGVINGRLML